MGILKGKKGDLVSLLALLGLWAWFHRAVIFQGHVFMLQDSSRFFFPLWKWGAGVWAQGTIPLWDPDAGFGTPYQADPQMANGYGPLRFLYSFLSPVDAFDASILFHHLWALLGSWAYARVRGASPWTALCGTLLFGFSFNAISLGWATPMLFAFSWIPWIFLTFHFLREGKSGSFWMFSAALALQLSAGYPLFAYLTLLTLGVHWILGTLGRWEKGRRLVGLPGLLGALLVALVFNATWILPFREFMPWSNLAARMGMATGLGWDDLVSFLNPFVKGHPLHSAPDSPYSVTVFFAGLPPLVMVLWGAWKSRSRLPGLLLLALLIVLSLGHEARLGDVLSSILPAYRMVVRSGYWIPFVVWTLSLIFIYIAKEWEAERNPAIDSTIFWCGSGILVYGLALGAGVPWQLASFWLSLLCVLLAGVLRDLPVRQLLISLALVLSLGPVAQSIDLTLDRSFYDQPPLALQRLKGGGRLYNAPSLEDHFRNVSGNGVADAYDKLKQAIVSNWPLAWGLEEAGYSNALFLRSSLDWYYAPFLGQGPEKILDYLSVRSVIGWMPQLKGFPEASAGEAPLWENRGAAPKWRSCQRAELGSDRTADLGRMNAKDFDFSRECFISDPTLVGSYGDRRIVARDRGVDRVGIEVQGSNREGKVLLISSETAYPGWEAKVGDRIVPVVEVNHGFRGVLLGPEDDHVELTYSPMTFRLGLFLSLAVMALWIFLTLRWMRFAHA